MLIFVHFSLFFTELLLHLLLHLIDGPYQSQPRGPLPFLNHSQPLPFLQCCFGLDNRQYKVAQLES